MTMHQRRFNRKFTVESLETRSLLSGGLNPSFGTGGFSTFSINGPSSDKAAGVAIEHQADGKIVVAGTATGDSAQGTFAVARENANGTPDTSFGNGGSVFTSFGAGTSAAASDVAIQPDGKILVAGLVEGNINGTFGEDFAVIRYNTDGSLDSSFGTGGEILTDFGPNSFSEASSIAVTPAGKILVVGTTSADGGDFAMAQYNTDGSLDQAFGAGGKVVTSFGPNVFAADVNAKVGEAVLPDGQIVLAGLVLDSNSGFTLDFGLASFKADGSPDTSFGTGGEVITSFGDSEVSSVAGIAVEPGTSAIVVAGSLHAPTEFPTSFALARYDPTDGSLDTTFGTGGEVITPTAPGTSSTATGIAIQPADGNIVVSGTLDGSDSVGNSFKNLTLARYKAADGSLDASFGKDGEVVTSFGPGTLTAGSGVTIQADGKIVAAASVGGAVVGGFGLARYHQDGSLDSSFGQGGEVIINVPMPAGMITAGEAIQSDGKIVVAGTAAVLGPNGVPISDIVLTRFNQDGSLDTTFGTNGTVLTDFGIGGNQAAAVTIETDGEILVVGTASGFVNGQIVQDIGVALYNTNGSIEASFGHGGEVLVDFGPATTATASGVTIETDGTIVVAGSASGFDSNFNFFQDFALAALNPNGTVDNGFGTHGQVLTSFGPNTPAIAAGIAIEPDGKIVLAGKVTDPNTFVDEFALARYNKNGKLDNSFGTHGEVVTSFGPNTPASIKSVAIQSDGKIVVAGSITDRTTFQDEFALARYNKNGKLDNSFGTGGEVITSFGPNTSADAASVAIQSDGKIVVAGTVEDFNNGFTEGFGLARYNTNGSLDQNFGTGGEVVTNFGPNLVASAVDVVIGDDGELFVAGTLAGNNLSDFLLASYRG